MANGEPESPRSVTSVPRSETVGRARSRQVGVSQSVAMSISGHRTASMFERYNITDDRDQRQALQKVQQYRKGRRSEADRERVVAIAGE